MTGRTARRASAPRCRPARPTPLARLLSAVLAILALTVLAACTDAPTPPTGSSTTAATGAPTGSDGPSGPSLPPVDGVTPVGAKWDWARYDSYKPYLATLKGGYTYYEFVWCEVEPNQGQRDWSSVDQVAARTKELGMTLLLKIRVGMCWATDGQPQFVRGAAGKTESGMPKDMSAYQAFITEAVQRFSAQGVTSYALENEVNSPSYWGGTPDQLRQLITAGAAAIRKGSPQAKVVDFGLASTTYGYGIADDLLKAGNERGAVDAYKRYFARRIGTRGDKIPDVSTGADVQAVLDSEQGKRNLTYLAMATDLAKDKTVDIRQIHFYEQSSAVPDLLTYVTAHTPAGVPVQAWEVGSFDRSDSAVGAAGSAGDDASRTGEVAQTMTQIMAAGIGVAIWLPLAVNPAGRNSDEPRYGLIDPSGQVRAAGTVVSDVAAASRGATAVPVSKGGVSGVGFERGGSSVLYLWGSGASVKVPAGAKVGAVGQGPQPATGSTLTVSAVPIEVHLDGTVSSFLSAQ